MAAVHSRVDLRRRLFSVAADQAGYFTAAQAKDVGYSYQAQNHHLRAGNWVRVARGQFRMADWVPEAHDDLARWSVWSRRRGVISHETALGFHDIGEFEAQKVHLTVPPGFRMHHDAVVLHTADLPSRDVSQATGFDVTTPTRSLVDVATVVDGDQLTRAIEEARDRGLVTVRSLRDRAEAVDARSALYIERAIQSLPS